MGTVRLLKLVRKEGNRFTSSHASSDVSVDYKLGETTVPKVTHTPLMAFATLESALLESGIISGDLDTFAIFEVEAEPMDGIGSWNRRLSRPNTINAAEVAAYWKEAVVRIANCKGRRPYGPMDLNEFTLPDNTVLCSSITPLREVQASECRATLAKLGFKP